MNNKFDKTLFLTKFSIRRDAWKLLAWIIALSGMMTVIAIKFSDIYGSKSSILAIESTLKSTSMVSMFGSFDIPFKTSADVFGAEMLIFMAIMMIVMNIYFSVQGSIGEEGKGLTELISSKSVGKLAIIFSLTLEILILNLLVGILFGLGIQFSGMSGVTTEGAWLIALSLAMEGLFFGMVGLLMAQLADSTRTANILSYLVFGIIYIARIITDLKNPKLTWFNPLGIIEKISAFHANNWTPVFTLLVLCVVIWALAVFFNQYRDIGSGIFAARNGRSKASMVLTGPMSFVWRLHRVSIVVWSIGLLILGVTYGSIFNTIGDILKTNPTMQTVFGKGAVDAANHQILLNFLSIIVIVCIGLAVIPTVQIMNSLKSDQEKGYLENIYAKKVTRFRMFISYLFWSIFTEILSFFMSLLGVYFSGNSVLKHGKLDFEIYWHIFIAYLPVIFTVVAISAIIVGLIPKYSFISWIYVFYGIFSMYLGSLLKLPDWAKKITSFGWGNKVPVESINYNYVWSMLLISMILIIIGYIGYRNRDLV